MLGDRSSTTIRYALLPRCPPCPDPVLLEAELFAQRDELPVRRGADLDHARRDLARDDVALVEVHPIVDPAVDPRLARLATHGEEATVLVWKLRVEHEADRAGNAGVIARIGRMIG